MNGRVGTEVRVVAGVGRRRATFGVGEIGDSNSLFCARGPPKIGLVIREFTPKKIPIDRWDSALTAVNSLIDTREVLSCACHLMPRFNM